MSAKRDFGSFHSSNVEELISVSEVDYVPPELPADLPNFTNYRADPTSLPSFGLEMKKRHFLLEEECTFLNHGAFGAVLKEALTASQKWQTHIERQPLRFFDRESLPQLVHVVRRLAKFVGAVKKLLSHVAETTGAVIQTERITFPLISKEQIVETVKKSLKAGTRLAVFDHVPSNTAYIQPIKELIDICHGRGVPVLIDGAHTLGALPLALDALGADFYTSNAHKWFCNPKGCGFLHVGREWRDAVRPLVVSHGWGSGFSSEFMWSGLRDYSPFLALHTILDFWEAVGVDKIRQYNHQLLCSAAQLLMEEWNTGLLAPLEMCGSMALVQLPPHIAESKTKNYNAAELIQSKLYHEFNIEVPIKAVDGKLYVRISTHIYNELAEYQQLATAIKSIQT